MATIRHRSISYNIVLLIFLIFLISLSSFNVFAAVRYEGPRYVSEGDSFTIVCILDSYRIPKWYMNGAVHDVLSNESRTWVEEDRNLGVQKATLFVNKATFFHSGEYGCDRFDNHTHSLDVMAVEPDRGSGSSGSGSGDAKPWCHLLAKGQTITLDCDGNERTTAPGTFSWLRSNNTVEASTTTTPNEASDVHGFVFRMRNNRNYVTPAHAHIDGDQLSINVVDESDAGVYMCSNLMSILEANSIPSRTIGRLFYVLAPIEMEDVRPTTTAVLGSTHVIDCNAKTSPRPVITWYIDNDDLGKLASRRYPRITIQTGPDGVPNSRLVIREVQFEDQNVYTCRVAHQPCNIFKEMTRRLYITRSFLAGALGQPQQLHIGESKTGSTVYLGGEIAIVCQVPRGGLPVWLKDGAAFRQNERIRLRQDMSTQGVTIMHLHIVRLTSDDAGEYACSSDSGSSLTIRVVPPRSPVVTNEEVPGEGIMLKRGYGLTIQCNDTVNVNAPIQWSKDGVPITADNHFLIDEDSHTLKVHRPSLDDAGNYTCSGPSGSTTIQVKAPVSIESNEQSRNQVEGDTLTLTCVATGRPMPNVKWFKADAPLNMSDSRITLEPYQNISDAKLMIKNLQFSDRAEYKCFAYNDYSNDTITINVRVKDKYAALWPFLGICIEVTILCIIIFIYEKRRVKPEFEETDNDRTAAENKNVAEQKEGQVRQRK